MHNMFRAIRLVVDEHLDVKTIYPIHMNPVVRKAADEEVGEDEAEYGKMAHACERRGKSTVREKRSSGHELWRTEKVLLSN